MVALDGRKLDLLGFDPRTARELFAREGVRGLSMELTVPIRNGSREVARIVQAQWREHLGVNLRLREVEVTAWEQNAIHAEYRDAIEDSWTAFYEDPYDFLVEFGPAHYVATTWTDQVFDAALDANRMADRMSGLALNLRRAFFEPCPGSGHV
jgi:ABC-type oligopeptide transport system substrate-binding subunit